MKIIVKWDREPATEPFGDDDEDILVRDWKVTISICEQHEIWKHYYVTVKKGFVCDNASIPRIFWRILGAPKNGRHRRSGILHDALYRTRSFTRELCDLIFLESMKREGKWWLTRQLVYLGVQWFGGFVWNGYTELAVERAQKFVTIY